SYGFALIYPGTAMEIFAKEQGILDKNFSWNSTYRAEKYRITGGDPSVPYMEWPGMEVEKVKAFMVKNTTSRKDLLKKGWRKIKKIKDWDELKILIKAGLNYLKL
ncbi:hypothetical protein KKH35_02075, partial [Patescibacteria group bacterium]|nr:hypothetical protein [Patescibacteria group bacterium]